MKKWTTLVIISIVLVGSFLLYSSLYGNPVSKYRMVKATKQYLLEKGYKEEDIISVESAYHMKRNSDRMKGTVSYVVFRDEPKIKYLYIQWRNPSQVQQHCSYYDEETKLEELGNTEKRNHLEANCTQSDG